MIAAMDAAGAALFDLSGRTALVTGASRGIGAAAARALDQAGARVVLSGRDARRLLDVSGECDNDPVTAVADLADAGGPATLLARLDALQVDVDILINNAGVHVSGSAGSLTHDDWDRVQGTNVRSAFLLSRGLAPAMLERGWGKIVNVGSILGTVADIEAAAYVTSKTALLGLTRALAVEWAAGGVTVNALCPGWTRTDMVAGMAENAPFDRRVVRRTPMGRWAVPEDLAGALVFLSSRASDFITGQTLVVDGGLTAAW